MKQLTFEVFHSMTIDTTQSVQPEVEYVLPSAPAYQPTEPAINDIRWVVDGDYWKPQIYNGSEWSDLGVYNPLP